MPKVFDIFPFFDELDVLEVRLNELDSVVDTFVICESGETYGGEKKPYYLQENFSRFAAFRHKIVHIKLPTLEPACADRVTGRLREAFQRNAIWSPFVSACQPAWSDYLIFSDCDEIPSAESVKRYLMANDNVKFSPQPARFKQTSFYYNVNTVVDYGHDFASRSRIGWLSHVPKQKLYDFRMLGNKDPEFQVVENGGWHFGYFGSIDKIKRKVAALSPFLNEYKLFGDVTLIKDIREGRDLHHRRCELPERFTFRLSDDPTLPAFLRNNLGKFRHFTREGQVG